MRDEKDESHLFRQVVIVFSVAVFILRAVISTNVCRNLAFSIRWYLAQHWAELPPNIVPSDKRFKARV